MLPNSSASRGRSHSPRPMSGTHSNSTDIHPFSLDETARLTRSISRTELVSVPCSMSAEPLSRRNNTARSICEHQRHRCTASYRDGHRKDRRRSGSSSGGSPENRHSSIEGSMIGEAVFPRFRRGPDSLPAVIVPRRMAWRVRGGYVAVHWRHRGVVI
jgi:hypothetical protein